MKDILTARAMRKIALHFPMLFPCYYYPKDNLQTHVYLTFDDGPDPVITPKILALLQRKKMKATFFVGGNALIYPDICKEIIAEGHSVGGHTSTHPYLPKVDKHTFINETIGFNNQLSDMLGVDVNLFRPPYGFINPFQIYILRNNGLKIVLWTLDTLDCFPEPPLEQKVVSFSNQIKSHDIILIHDTINKNIDYTRMLVDSISRKKFTLSKIS